MPATNTCSNSGSKWCSPPFKKVHSKDTKDFINLTTSPEASLLIIYVTTLYLNIQQEEFHNTRILDAHILDERLLSEAMEHMELILK